MHGVLLLPSLKKQRELIQGPIIKIHCTTKVKNSRQIQRGKKLRGIFVKSIRNEKTDFLQMKKW